MANLTLQITLALLFYIGAADWCCSAHRDIFHNLKAINTYILSRNKTNGYLDTDIHKPDLDQGLRILTFSPLKRSDNVTYKPTTYGPPTDSDNDSQESSTVGPNNPQGPSTVGSPDESNKKTHESLTVGPNNSQEGSIVGPNNPQERSTVDTSDGSNKETHESSTVGPNNPQGPSTVGPPDGSDKETHKSSTVGPNNPQGHSTVGPPDGSDKDTSEPLTIGPFDGSDKGMSRSDIYLQKNYLMDRSVKHEPEKNLYEAYGNDKPLPDVKYYKPTYKFDDENDEQVLPVLGNHKREKLYYGSDDISEQRLSDLYDYLPDKSDDNLYGREPDLFEYYNKAVGSHEDESDNESPDETVLSGPQQNLHRPLKDNLSDGCSKDVLISSNNHKHHNQPSKISQNNWYRPMYMKIGISKDVLVEVRLNGKPTISRSYLSDRWSGKGALHKTTDPWRTSIDEVVAS